MGNISMLHYYVGKPKCSLYLEDSVFIFTSEFNTLNKRHKMGSMCRRPLFSSSVWWHHFHLTSISLFFSAAFIKVNNSFAGPLCLCIDLARPSPWCSPVTQIHLCAPQHHRKREFHYYISHSQLTYNTSLLQATQAWHLTIIRHLYLLCCYL